MRITWRDSEPEDQSTPLAWTSVAMIIATLFLNFSFWMEYGQFVWAIGSLPRIVLVFAATSPLVTALFFAGPALASHRAGKPLFGIVEASFGSIAAWAIRLVAVWLLLSWIATFLAVPASWFLRFILRHDVSQLESGAIAAVLFAFILLTGLRSFRTNVKLAFFTNKFAVAILIAAMIRVRTGLPAALGPSARVWTTDPIGIVAWHHLSRLAFYVGPLVFMTSGFGCRLAKRTQLAKLALAGIALPLCATLIAVGLISRATFHSWYYQPSLEPTVAMALWSKTAGSAMPARMMLVSVTILGGGRFCARALRDTLRTPQVGPRIERVLLGLAGVIVIWLATHYVDVPLFDSSTMCLGLIAAVVTADWLAGATKTASVRRIDWIGLGALAAGIATAFAIKPHPSDLFFDEMWQPAALPSYAVSFLTCLLGRGLAKRLSRTVSSA